jgi:nucleoside-diphosphate-sugar epimerase
MQDVLILGAEGQVGSALTSHLLSNGHNVEAFDMDLDLRDAANIEKLSFLLQWAEFTFFLAFDVGGSTYLKKHQSSVEFLDNNVRIMSNFAEAHQRATTEAGRPIPFIFTSSQMSSMPWSQYGTLKRLGEFYTQALGGYNVRFWNVFGNETDPEKFHVVTDFINSAMKDYVIRMKTDGLEKRQMLHALDASRALEALMENVDSLRSDLFYDVTSFEWVSIMEIAEEIQAVMGPDVVRDIIAGEASDEVQRDFGNEPSSPILEFWQPTMTLRQGIEEVLRGVVHV